MPRSKPSCWPRRAAPSSPAPTSPSSTSRRCRPTTIDVIEAIDAMPKPVIAALHGTPLGGGLEVALGCHFRVAAPGTRLGLPEIKLGLMPGAGGTQRLPRLIGMEKAMAMILSGDPIGAEDALKSRPGRRDRRGRSAAGGDRICANAWSPRSARSRRARDRDDKLAELRANPAKFDELAAPYAQARARPACAGDGDRGVARTPRRAVRRSADRASATTFVELRDGEQSKAQRHIFFAEREAAKVAGPAEGREAARDQAGRGDRRRHHGRRHRHVLRQCRHSGHDRRDQRRRRSSAASIRSPRIIAASPSAAPDRGGGRTPHRPDHAAPPTSPRSPTPTS